MDTARSTLRLTSLQKYREQRIARKSDDDIAMSFDCIDQTAEMGISASPVSHA
jgi:hypothetical protein